MNYLATYHMYIMNHLMEIINNRWYVLLAHGTEIVYLIVLHYEYMANLAYKNKMIFGISLMVNHTCLQTYTCMNIYAYTEAVNHQWHTDTEKWFRYTCIPTYLFLLTNAWMHAYTVECRYNVVQFNRILSTALQRQEQNLNQTSNSQQTPHASPLWTSYRVSIVKISEKTDCVITAPNCIFVVCFLMRAGSRRQVVFLCWDQDSSSWYNYRCAQITTHILTG